MSKPTIVDVLVWYYGGNPLGFVTVRYRSGAIRKYNAPYPKTVAEYLKRCSN